MSRGLVSVVFAMSAIYVLTGCVMGHAELVSRNQAGGILALKGQREPAMQDAQAQMQAHCGGPYTIVNEEMAVVGEQTQAQQSGGTHQYGRSNYQSGSSSSTTTAVTEYRITYTCGAAQAAPAPAPAPTGAQPVPVPVNAAPAQ
jgi:hypothetical protein